MFESILTFYRIQLKRHLRNKLLWCIALTTPIVAKYLVPTHNDGYTIVAVNNAYPILSSSVIGMELGVLSALLLSPLFYIYLRVSRIKISPWQIEDVSPLFRSKQTLGHWLADTSIAFLLISTLALAGVILSFFRLPLEQINPLHTFLTCLLIALPAFSFIAALRLIFSARPWLRKALGDVFFFIFWIIGIGMGANLAATPASLSLDIFGYAAPIVMSTNQPITSFVVGSSPNAIDSIIQLEPLNAVKSSAYQVSRVMLLLYAGILAMLSGLVYATKKHTTTKHKSYSLILFGNIIQPLHRMLVKVITLLSSFCPPLLSNLKQFVLSPSTTLLLAVLAILGAFLPFRGLVGPAIWLVAMFPLCYAISLWEKPGWIQFADTLPQSRKNQFVWQCVSASTLMIVLCIPAFVRCIVLGEYIFLPDFIFICLFLPFIIMSLGRLTHSAAAPRLVLIIVWYFYFNL